MTQGTRWEAVVVGAGVGGLVAAGLLARAGRRVLLLEAHDTPGGCAGFYEAGGFTFDAGATTLLGFFRQDRRRRSRAGTGSPGPRLSRLPRPRPPRTR